MNSFKGGCGKQRIAHFLNGTSSCYKGEELKKSKRKVCVIEYKEEFLNRTNFLKINFKFSNTGVSETFDLFFNHTFHPHIGQHRRDEHKNRTEQYNVQRYLFLRALSRPAQTNDEKISNCPAKIDCCYKKIQTLQQHRSDEREQNEDCRENKMNISRLAEVRSGCLDS